MKIKNYFIILGASLAFNIAAYAQNESGVDSTGLPGDNFSLQGALEMFKKAGSPEEFEKLINSENNSVNNLDLNGDGDIDYIRVIDKSDKDAHAFIMQVAVSATETQDVAVIELEKTGASIASLQIIGDEDLYGEPVIVEPSGTGGATGFVAEESDLVARGGPLAPESSYNENSIVNVFFWPSVRYIYAPAYRPWASPWRWHYYPGWWRPWRPFAWHVFQPRIYRYHRPYVIVHANRLVRARQVYRPIRVSSVTVRTRQSVVIDNYRASHTRSNHENKPSGNAATRLQPHVFRTHTNSVNHTSTTVRKKNSTTKSRQARTRRHR